MARAGLGRGARGHPRATCQLHPSPPVPQHGPDPRGDKGREWGQHPGNGAAPSPRHVFSLPYFPTLFLFSPSLPFYSLFSPSFSFSPFSLIFPVPVLFLSPALNNAERKRGQAWLKSSLIITGPPRDLGSGSPPQHPERRMRSPAPLPSRGQRLGTSRSRLRAGGRGIPQIRVVLAVKIQLLCVTQTAPKWDGVVVLPN